jgi:putative transposase
MRFGFIHDLRQEHPEWPLAALCRVLCVSRSGYASWHRRQGQAPTPREQQKQHREAQLLLHIRAAHRRGRGYYGSPRVHRALREQGIRVSRKCVARLMGRHGLQGRCRARRTVRTTNSRHALPIAPNILARRFAPVQVESLNRFWCGDITYLPTSEGWLYLATVQDLFSRRIIGWSLHETLEATLVEQAWQHALRTRGFSSGQGPQLYHSDRGSQYASDLFQQQLEQAGTLCSMSEKGECLDNAVAESFFGTYKAELLADQPQGRFTSKAQARALRADYIDGFYNTVRLHSTLDYKSPVAFELAHRRKEIEYKMLLSSCPL